MSWHTDWTPRALTQIEALALAAFKRTGIWPAAAPGHETARQATIDRLKHWGLA